jgi:tetratricopeptide (TPR) repeat protein
VYSVTTNPAGTKYNEELEDELLSPTLSDIGSEGEEGDIYEHLDEVEPTRNERYEGSGAAIWFTQGFKQSQIGMYQKAIDYYQQGIKLDRNYTNIVYNMGCAFERRNNWILAKKWFIKALRNWPGNLMVIYALALISYKLGEYGDCEFYTLKCMDLTIDEMMRLKLFWLMALTYRHLDDFKKATVNYEYLIQHSID